MQAVGTERDTMLSAIPRGLFSWGFSILEDDAEVAGLDVAWMRERGTLDIMGAEFTLYRQGWLSGSFLLEGDGVVFAEADKPNAFTRRFEVTHGHRTLSLVAQSPFTRAFSVYDGDRQIGSICPDHCFTRKTTIDLPDDIALPVKAFLFWLVVLMWRRAKKNN
jgi:hypothetical protein